MGKDSLELALKPYMVSKKRDLPWRTPSLKLKGGVLDIYRVLLSEFMLQQTQVKRVIEKYEQFLQEYPTMQDLAQAPRSTVLKSWLGLGYNRRAIYLHEAAKDLCSVDLIGYEDLVSCKGIGPNTAAAICVYTYNEPRIFVETNIRTVLWKHFFEQEAEISDKQFIVQLEEVVDTEDPREWYYALMDYGTDLKAQNKGHMSVFNAYSKQSRFEGSRRQLRAAILRRLIDGPMSLQELDQEISDCRLHDVLQDLQKDTHIARTDDVYSLM